MLALEQARGMIESTRADIAKRQGQLAQANNALQLLLGSINICRTIAPAAPWTCKA